MASPFKEKITAQLNAMPERDRRALVIMVIAVTLTVVYMLIWEPIMQWSEESRKEYQSNMDTLAFIQANEQAARQSTSQGVQQVSRDKLSAVVTGAARQQGIKLSRVQPSNEGVTVWMDQVAYQKLLAWVINLHNQYHFSIDKIRIDAQDEAGMVRAYLSITM
ncbi:type II secretion system protein M [Zooshikella marina]|uniref:type II secretion system protein GspM n=1 Tax=Zooshikella ganghwensis TaxID=202772 RepID=UPI001BB06BE1|nr:type II secretion system protein M [Zooshikella ganghwensis]MBU2704400.1 type II secretion system protein M [Zooshikella ganghwensis]